MRRALLLSAALASGGCGLIIPPPPPEPPPPETAFDPAAPGVLVAPPAGVAPVAWVPPRGTLQPEVEQIRACAETHARNIAHAETPAYKAVRRHGLGGAAACDWSTGSLQQTGRPLDLAIDGEGFLCLTLPDGTPAYTRGGRFHRHADGRLATGAGLILEPMPAIPPEATRVTIGPRGHVDILDATGLPRQLARLSLTRFVNPSGLDPLGHNLWGATAASGPAEPGAPGEAGLGRLVQGSLEGSNVDLLAETEQLLADQQAIVRLKGLEDPP
jgi:flagellar basal body rod protein FlgG